MLLAKRVLLHADTVHSTMVFTWNYYILISTVYSTLLMYDVTVHSAMVFT